MYLNIQKLYRSIFSFLASAKLAMFLLIVILCCCLTGVTVVRNSRAWELIFSTFWFNSLLVLLVINVGCCFFGRIWGRKITLISFGMILFHLSFVVVFLGIVYNSLFNFRGVIRLTEGEVLENSDSSSYDTITAGRLFNFNHFRGQILLNKLHIGYKEDGQDKRVAYEVTIGIPANNKHELFYITKHLEYRGVKYFPEKEGFSVLTVLYDKTGHEKFGMFIPLQSLKTTAGARHYTIGTKDVPAFMAIPTPPSDPVYNINLSYSPDKELNRKGSAEFQIFNAAPGSSSDDLLARGKADIGRVFKVSDEYSIAAKEVRYWAAMSVKYEPGQPIILASLWVGLLGMVLTTLGRVSKQMKVAASDSESLS